MKKRAIARQTEEPKPLPEPGEFLVRLRRPDGSETLLKLPGEQFDRVMALAAGEFGDKSIVGVGVQKDTGSCVEVQEAG